MRARCYGKVVLIGGDDVGGSDDEAVDVLGCDATTDLVSMEKDESLSNDEKPDITRRPERTK